MYLEINANKLWVTCLLHSCWITLLPIELYTCWFYQVSPSSGSSWSINLTCVKGKNPCLPFTVPSHCPFKFMAVTNTSSPTYNHHLNTSSHYKLWNTQKNGARHQLLNSLILEESLLCSLLDCSLLRFFFYLIIATSFTIRGKL